MNDVQRPVLFLDVDGVMNDCDPRHFLKYAIDNVCTILRATDCVIVLSSSWRWAPSWRSDMISCCGNEDITWTDSIVSTTVLDDSMRREEQILLWVQENDVKHWAVVDDDALNLPPTRFVKTNSRVGLDTRAKERLIALLNT